MTIYNVIDNDSEWGINVFSFNNKEQAKGQFLKLLKEYEKSYGEFSKDSHIGEYWADISDKNGEFIGFIEVKETVLI